jgi:hypothetical protein
VNFILSLLGGKLGLPILIAAGVAFLAMLAVIGGQQLWIGKLEKDLAVAKATEAVALAANKSCEASVGKVNAKVDALITAEMESGKRIADAMARVQKSARALLSSAEEIANRPLPANPAQDCSVMESEIRAYVEQRKQR